MIRRVLLASEFFLSVVSLREREREEEKGNERRLWPNSTLRRASGTWVERVGAAYSPFFHSVRDQYVSVTEEMTEW